MDTVGKGAMIYGGTEYNKELGELRRYLPIIAELERKRRAIRMPRAVVDKIAAKVKRQVEKTKFNDSHLVALVIASECCIVCTNDKVAMPYIKRRDLCSDYGLKPPKIYSSERHGHLCCDAYLARVCLAKT